MGEVFKTNLVRSVSWEKLIIRGMHLHPHVVGKTSNLMIPHSRYGEYPKNTGGIENKALENDEGNKKHPKLSISPKH